MQHSKQTEIRLKQISKLILLLNKKLEEIKITQHNILETEIQECLEILHEELEIIEFDLVEYLKNISQKQVCLEENSFREQAAKSKWKRFTEEFSTKVNYEKVDDWLNQHNRHAN